VQVLEGLDSRAVRRNAASWLVGRVGEVECLVGDLILDWRLGDMSAADAAQSVNAYLHALHRGLATNFGELAPSCCMSSLVVTASPASFLEVTRSFPPSSGSGWADVQSTWGEVEDAEILDSTWIPSSR